MRTHSIDSIVVDVGVASNAFFVVCPSVCVCRLDKQPDQQQLAGDRVCNRERQRARERERPAELKSVGDIASDRETTTSTEIYCGYAVGSRPPADRCLAASVDVDVDVDVDLKCRRLPPASCCCCCCFLIFVLIGFGIATRIRIRLPVAVAVAVAVAGSKDQAHLHCVLRALSLDLEGGKWRSSK